MTALPRRLPARGPVAERWQRHREESRRAVFFRAAQRGGRCEAEDCSNQAEEWSHLFGRRQHIAEPWASSPACTMALCRSHHRAIDANLDPDLLERLRWCGVVRLCKAEGIAITGLSAHDVLGAIRAVEGVLRSRE